MLEVKIVTSVMYEVSIQLTVAPARGEGNVFIGVIFLRKRGNSVRRMRLEELFLNCIPGREERREEKREKKRREKKREGE